MAIYTVELDGKQFDIEGPEGATEDELYQAATEHQNAGGTPPESNPTPSFMDSMGNMAANSGPLGAVGVLGLKAMGKVQEGFDRAGEATAEGLASGVTPTSNPLLPPPFNIGFENTPGKGIRTSPEVAAAAGTAVSMAPDLATAWIPGSKAKAAGEIATAAVKGTKAGQFVKKVGRALTGPNAEEARIAAQNLRNKFTPQAANKAKEVGLEGIREAEGVLNTAKKEAQDILLAVKDKSRPLTEKAIEVAKSRLAPLKEEIASLRERMIDISPESRAKLTELESLKEEAGKAIEEAENLGGFGFKTSPKFESQITNKKFTSRVAQKLRKYEGQPEAMLENLKPKSIQKVRKLFQEESALSNIGHAEGQRLRETSAKALELKSPDFAEARGRWQKAADAIDNIGTESKAKAESIRKALGKARDAFKAEAADAKEMISKVRGTEEKAIGDTIMSKKREVKKQVIDAAARLQKSKHDAQELLQKAKEADQQELIQIKDKASKMIEEGLENTMLMKKIKVAGGVAATAIGLPTLGKLIK